MDFENLFGLLSTIAALVLILGALPMQIKKNYREKECGMNSLWVISAPFLHITRIGYAIALHSVWLLIPDCIGMVFASVIVYQWWIYRKPRSAEHKSMEV